MDFKVYLALFRESYSESGSLRHCNLLFARKLKFQKVDETIDRMFN